MIQRVLLPLDGSHCAEAALPHAAAIARSFDADIILFQVIDTDNTIVDSVDWRLKEAEAAAYLGSVARQLAPRGVGFHTGAGKPAEQTIAFAQQEEVDLIILCTHGRGGASEFNVSSTAYKILSGVGRSVMLVRPPEEGAATFKEITYNRVLVPLDGSFRSDWAAHIAATVARAGKAELWTAQVVPVPEMARRLPRSHEDIALAERVIASNRDAAHGHMLRMEKELSGSDLPVTSRVLVSAHVPDAIDQLVCEEEIDLVILSAHGHTASSCRPYGTVAATLLTYGTGPVVVLQDLQLTKRPPEAPTRHTQFASSQRSPPLAPVDTSTPRQRLIRLNHTPPRGSQPGRRHPY
jgi:nucleotide-binding universal stress UspA family protein